MKFIFSLAASLILFASASSFASTTETCIVAQVSGNRVSSSAYPLAEGKDVVLKTDLLKNIDIALKLDSGWIGKDGQNFATVSVKISDANKGSVIESLIRENRNADDGVTEQNLSTLNYQIDASDRIAVSCTKIPH